MQLRGLLSLLVCAVLVLLIWSLNSDPDPITDGPADGTSDQIVEASPSLEQAANAPLESKLSSSASELQRQELESDEILTAKGKASYRDGSAAAGYKLVGSVFRGYDRTGELILEKEVTTDSDGNFSWDYPRLEASTHVSVKVGIQDTYYGMGSSKTVVKGDEPPVDLTATVFDFDRKVKIFVTDQSRTPLEGAKVLSFAEEVQTDAAGKATMKFSNDMSSFQGFARADGYAQQEKFADLSEHLDPQLSFKLHPEMRVSGRVINASYEPIEGAEIHVFGVQKNTVYSAADGSFNLHHLDAQKQYSILFAKKDGYVEGRVDLTKGENVIEGVEVILNTGCRVEGTLSSVSGKPIEAATLFIGRNQSSYNRIDSRSNDKGQFVFPVVAPGQQKLHIAAEGFSSKIIDIEIPSDAEALDPLQIQLDDGVHLGGRIEDPDGKGVPDAHLSMRIGQSYSGGRSKTDSEGNFRIDSAPEDGFVLEVYCRGYSRERFEIAPQQLNQSNFVGVLSPIGRLAGRVVDGTTGKPLAAFRVSIRKIQSSLDNHRGLGIPGDWFPDGKLFRNEAGEWKSGDEEIPMNYFVTLRFTADGYAPIEAEPRQATAEADPSNYVVSLFPGSEISGVVLNAETGEPISGSHVQCFSEEVWSTPGGYMALSAEAHTDENGGYKLENLGRGNYFLIANHGDHSAAKAGPIQVQGISNSAPNIELGQGSSISGFALDLSGKPVTHANIRLRSYSQNHLLRRFAANTKTDSKGHFEFSNLVDGGYQIKWERGDEYPLTLIAGKTVEIKGGVPVEVDLKQVATGSLRGTVSWTENIPSGTQIGLNFAPEDPEQSSESRHYFAKVIGGKFHFPEVPVGRYKLHCAIIDLKLERPERAYAEAIVVISAGNESSCQLELASRN